MLKCDFCKEVALYEMTFIADHATTCKVCEKHKAHFVTLYGNCTIKSLVDTGIENKKCVICGITKPISDFYGYTDRKGVPRLRTECKMCNLEERKSLTFRKK